MNAEKLNKPNLIIGACIVGLAFLVRFLQLGAQALTDNEALLALQALNPGIQWSGQPLYLVVTSAIFSLAGHSNWAARLFPAVTGLAVVALPLLFRKRLGTNATLVLMALLALDPALIHASRVAGGYAGTVLMAGLLASSIDRKNAVAAGLAAGFLLLSGSGLWALLLPPLIVILLFFVIYRRQPVFPVIMKQVGMLLPEKRKFLAGLAFSVLIVSTAFLLFPQVLSSFPNSSLDYLRTWQQAGEIPYTVFLPGIVVYFPIGLIFGIWGGIRRLSEREPRGVLLFFWMVISLVLLLIQPRFQLAGLLWVVPPAYLLAGPEIARHLPASGTKISALPVSLLVVTITSFLYLSVARIVFTGDQRGLLLAIIGGVVILALSALLIMLGWSGEVAANGYLWGSLVMLGLFSISIAWRTAGITEDRNYELIGDQSNYPQLFVIRDTLEDLSLSTTGTASGLDVQVVGNTSPALEWMMLDFPKTRYVQGLEATNQAPVVITLEGTPANLVEQYRGQDFIFSEFIPWNEMDVQEWIEWLVYRKAPVSSSRLVLWARADLFPGGTIDPVVLP